MTKLREAHIYVFTSNQPLELHVNIVCLCDIGYTESQFRPLMRVQSFKQEVIIR